MMKTAVVLCSLMLLACAYESSHDDFDVDKLVKNKEELKKFAACFIHNTDCDKNSEHFKADLQEVYEQACAKCNQVQKHMLKKFIQALKEQLPEEYEELKKKYDPEGKYSLPLETAVANA